MAVWFFHGVNTTSHAWSQLGYFILLQLNHRNFGSYVKQYNDLSQKPNKKLRHTFLNIWKSHIIKDSNALCTAATLPAIEFRVTTSDKMYQTQDTALNSILVSMIRMSIPSTSGYLERNSKAQRCAIIPCSPEMPRHNRFAHSSSMKIRQLSLRARQRGWRFALTACCKLEIVGIDQKLW
jgi:hypothetical protein